MATKFVLSTEHDDDAALFALALATMSNGAVNVREAVVVQVDGDVLADALGQLLDATGRVYTRVEELTCRREETPAMIWHSEFVWTDSVCGPEPVAAQEVAAPEVPVAAAEEEQPVTTDVAVKGLHEGLMGDSPVVLAEARVETKKQKRQQGAGLEPRVCDICGDTYQPRRKDQTNCGKAACKKAVQRKWQANWTARQRAGTDEGEAMGSFDVLEAEAFLGELEAEWAAQEVPVAAQEVPTAEELPAVEGPGHDQPELVAEEEKAPMTAAQQADARTMVRAAMRKTAGGEIKMWLVESGPRAGEWLTSHELSVALQLGNMRVGQVLKHRDGARKKVYKPVGKSYQKLTAVRE